MNNCKRVFHRLTALGLASVLAFSSVFFAYADTADAGSRPAVESEVRDSSETSNERASESTVSESADVKGHAASDHEELSSGDTVSDAKAESIRDAASEPSGTSGSDKASDLSENEDGNLSEEQSGSASDEERLTESRSESGSVSEGISDPAAPAGGSEEEDGSPAGEAASSYNDSSELSATGSDADLTTDAKGTDESPSGTSGAGQTDGISAVQADDTVVSPAATDNKELKAFSASKVVNGVRVTVTAPEGVFPEGAKLSVKKVSAASVVKNIEAAVETERSEDASVASSYVFDIKVLKDGEEIEPDTSYGSVSVRFTLIGKKAADALNADVYHVTDAGDQDLVAEKLETILPSDEDDTATPGNMPKASGNDTVVAVETDSFSYYVVEFTYEAMQYVLQGGQTVLLSEILETLGIEGEIEEASVSDSTLLGLAPVEDGADREVTALKAFSSEEWLDVTVDGFTYRIVVTDESSTTQYTVTFYYGMPIYRQVGDNEYYAMTVSGGETSYPTEAEAKSNAADHITYTVEAGQMMGSYPFTDEYTNFTNDNGKFVRMSKWINTADSSEYSLDTGAWMNYTPSSDVTFTMQWKPVYEVVFDYGMPIAWEENGSFMALNQFGYGDPYQTEAEAKSHALSKLTYYAAENESLMNSPWVNDNIAFEKNGANVKMSGWISSEDPSAVKGLYEIDFWSYTPSSDVTFTMQWAEVYKVTFDYGMPLIWEENGYYNYVNSDGYVSLAETKEEAEQDASSTGTFYVEKGEEFQNSPWWDNSRQFDQNGATVVMSRWINADDPGDYPLEFDFWSYRPSGDTVFTMEWSEAYTVTFDYGDKIIWEADGGYNYTTKQGIWSTSDRTEAENNASRYYILPVKKGESLGTFPGYPAVLVNVNGQDCVFDGWVSADGNYEYGTSDIYSFEPQGDITFEAKWTTDYYKIKFDYTFAPVWENSDGTFNYYNGGNGSYFINWYSDSVNSPLSELEYCVRAGKTLEHEVYWQCDGIKTVHNNGTEYVLDHWVGSEGTVIDKDDTYNFKPEKDETFTAVWTAAKYYNVKLHLNNGDADRDYKVLEGTKYYSDFFQGDVTGPADSTGNYTIYIDSKCEKTFDIYSYENDGIRQDLDLYIKWEYEGGWQQQSDGWHYVYNNGDEAKDTLIDDNGWLYYVDENGIRLDNGWKSLPSNDSYYLDLGLKTVWRYFGQDGKAYMDGIETVDGKSYAFDWNGVRCAGYVDSGLDMYLNKDPDSVLYSNWFCGPFSTAEDSDHTKNAVVNGWVNCILVEDYEGDYRKYSAGDTIRVYYDSANDGQKVSNTSKVIGGTEYRFDSCGVAQESAYVWYQDNGKWYHGLPDKSEYDTEVFADKDGEKKFLGKDGAMLVEQLFEFQGEYYYADNEGTIITRMWVAIEADAQDKADYGENYRWYFFKDQGKAVRDRIRYTIDGNRFGFDVDGKKLFGYCVDGAEGMEILPLSTVDPFFLAERYYGNNGDVNVGPGSNDAMFCDKWLPVEMSEVSAAGKALYEGYPELWFWFDPNGIKYVDGQKMINGYEYRFDANGVCLMATITFDKDGGSNGTDSILAMADSDLQKIEIPEKKGYTFEGYYADVNDDSTKYYNADGTGACKYDTVDDMTLTAKWTPKEYEVSFEAAAHGTAAYTSDSDRKMGGTVKLTLTPDVGYELDSVTAVAEEDGSPVTINTADYSFTMPASDVKVTAAFKAKSGISYKVEHYQQKADGSGYEESPKDTDTLTGTTDEETAAAAKSYDGFTAGTITQQKIAGDGSTVVKIMYDRNSYTIHFEMNGHGSTADINALYGAAVSAPADPSETGFDFGGWYEDAALTKAYTFGTMPLDGATVYAKWDDHVWTADMNLTAHGTAAFAAGSEFIGGKTISLDLVPETGYGVDTVTVAMADGSTVSVAADYSFVMPLSDITVTVTFKALPVGYKVQHFKQLADGSGYETVPSDEDPLTGITGEATEATVKTYAGFETPSIVQGIVAGDGSTVIEIRYDRKSYTITFDMQGHGTAPADITALYEAAVSAPADPSETGFDFGGWFEDAALTKAYTFDTMPVDGATVYAKWTDHVWNATLAPTSNGTASLDSSSVYTAGGKVKINVTPDTGFKLNKIRVTKTDGTEVTVDADNSFVMPLSDVTVTVTFKDVSSLSYRVEHYKQNLDGSYPAEPSETEDLSGMLGADTKAQEKTYDGFEAPAAITQEKIKEDESTVVVIRYARKSYTISFNMNGHGTAPADITALYEAAVTAPADPEAYGYDFTGWYKDAGCTQKYSFGTMPAADTAVYAGWAEHPWKAELSETKNGTAALDETSVYTKGGTVKLILTPDTGYEPDQITVTAADGSTVTADMKDYSFTMPDADVTISVTFKGMSGIAYTVEHYLQKADGSGFEESAFDTEAKTGTAGEFTAAGQSDKKPAGFKAGTLTQQKIAGDGSTVVRVEYLRESYAVHFVMNGHGSAIADISALYEAQVTKPASPQDENYLFGGWFKEAAFENAAFDEEGKLLMPLGGMTVYAKWVEIAASATTVETAPGASIPSDAEEHAEELGNNTEVKVPAEGLLDAVDKSKLEESVNEKTGSETAVEDANELKIGIEIQLLSIELSEAQDGSTSVGTITFDATPYAELYDSEGTAIAGSKTEVGNDLLSGEITLRLPVPSAVTGKYTKVIHEYHDGGSEQFTCEILGSDPSRYVEFKVDRFSTFTLEFTDSYYEIADIAPSAFTGKAQTPAVTVTNGSETADASEYTVSYDNNTAAGTATVTVTIRRTGAMITKEFEIKKAAPEITVSDVNATEDGKAHGVSAAVKIPNGSAITEGISVKYYTDAACTAGETAAAPTAAGTYYAKVTVSGSDNYEEASKIVKITIGKKASASSSGTRSSGGGYSGGGSGGGGTGLSAVSTGSSEGSWSVDNAGKWSYRKDGVLYAGRWAYIANPYADASKGQPAASWFRFDDTGIMLTGWYRNEYGYFFYLNPLSDNTQGRMFTGWHYINGAWYYFEENDQATLGRLYVNTVTPDGSLVDADGKYVVGGRVVTDPNAKTAGR